MGKEGGKTGERRGKKRGERGTTRKGDFLRTFQKFSARFGRLRTSNLKAQ